jgi:DNA gyrase subunit A
MSKEIKENGENKADEEVKMLEDQRRLKEQIGNEKGVVGAEIVEEMEKAYIDYAMSVIVQRALPSAEDGLKPVHRRILHAMNQLGLDASKPTMKSARVVGDVMGKYHPHGDTAIYDTMVRLAQDFSLRYPLVHGQGNFGNMDGDRAAAMRYTEAKLSKISVELLQDIEKETVKMNPNFDNSLKEPETLPAKLPNLLLNGGTGIAVGMATNIPPHNLTELCDAIIAKIEKPKLEVKDLLEYVKGPDFPTGGIISSSGLDEIYKNGKGRVLIRGKTNTEENKGKTNIIITEIPFMVNKSDLVTNIAKLATEKKLPDVSDLRDESARGKIRIVIELKKNADYKFTLNKLFKLTRLQERFDANILAIVGKTPRVLNLNEIIEVYINYRRGIVTKRSEFDLRKAEDRLEIVLGLLIALQDIDAVVKLIRASKNTKEANDSLVAKFKLSVRQAKAILEMKLSQLTGLEVGKLKDEKKKLDDTIAELKKILSSDSEILKVIKKEVAGLKKDFGDERRTKIVKSFGEIKEKDLIEKKDVAVTLTNSGYVKRLDVIAYREQRRGGSGVSGTGLKDEDFVTHLVTCSTHDNLLFFTSRGRVYWLKANEVPEASKQSKGRAIANLLNLRDEEIANIMSVKDFDNDYLMFVTKKGIVKRLPLKDLAKPRSTGVRVINLPVDNSDAVIDVKRISEGQEVLLTTKKGKAVRFKSTDARSMGRASYGVRGIDLGSGDLVVSLVAIPEKEKISVLTITDKGFGKRSSVDDYRKTSRGGKGVINLKVGDKVGNVVKSMPVHDKNSIIMTSVKGMVVRISMKGLRVMGRATQGVRVVKLKVGDRIADAVRIPEDDEVVEG